MQLPILGHLPPFFHPGDGKDNGFISIPSKFSGAIFPESIHNQRNESRN